MGKSNWSSETGFSYKFTTTRQLTMKEEHALARDYRENGNRKSAHALVMAYLPMVVNVATRFNSFYGTPVQDLIQEGVLGLMRAVELFDPDRGLRLSGYAMFVIKSKIKTYITETWSLLKMGTTEVKRNIFFKLGMLPAPDDEHFEERLTKLADDYKVSTEVIREFYYRRMYRDFFLDAPTAEGGTCLDQVKEARLDPEAQVINHYLVKERKEIIEKAMQTLTEKERFVIENRYLTEDKWTQQEVGKHCNNVTKERARQIEVKALRKLRGALRDYEELLLAA